MKKVYGTVAKYAPVALLAVAGSAHAGGYDSGAELTGAGSSIALFVVMGLAVVIAGAVAYKMSQKKA